MRILVLALVGFFVGRTCIAEKRTAQELIDLAKAHRAELRAAIEATFAAKDLKEGTAWLGRGPEVVGEPSRSFAAGEERGETKEKPVTAVLVNPQNPPVAQPE